MPVVGSNDENVVASKTSDRIEENILIVHKPWYY